VDRGKVVVVEFSFNASQHCMNVAQVLKPPEVPTSGEKVIPSLVDYFKFTYPVDLASKADVIMIRRRAYVPKLFVASDIR
jgi:hypothetical protein